MMLDDNSKRAITAIEKDLGISQERPLYILAPHLDDAAWSMGSLLLLLSEAGFDITIVTVFSITPFVYESLRPPVEATLLRKKEDAAAVEMMVVKRNVRLDFPEGLLRDMELHEVINPEYAIPSLLERQILENLRGLLPEDATIFAPLALGGHVDHLVLRSVAQKLAQSKSSLFFYEDLPYMARGNDVVTEAQRFMQSQHLVERRVSLPKDMVGMHLRIFNTYKTQRNDADEKKIEAYLSSEGIGIWTSLEMR